MKIGVSIDGVLRDLLGKIEETHTKYFPPLEGEDTVEVLDYDLEKWLTFPEEEVKQNEIEFDLDFEEELVKEKEDIKLETKKTRVTIEEFLYEKCTVEVFGYAEESVSSAVESLNRLIIDNPQHEFIIISREGGMAIPSTHFFLAKTKSSCPNIKFVTEYKKVWDYVDIMITDHPKIINTKPLDKFNIVIDKDYNKKIVQSGYRVKTIKEINGELLDNFELVLGGADPNLYLR
tara:strand:+ start:24234 stop:24932 length:699 start_codon:yes stop_codon:yes gene_type:complete